MITKTLLATFRNDFNKAVDELEKKYNVKIEMKAISYTDMNFHFKVVCNEVGESGTKKIDMNKFGLMKSILGFNGNYGDKFVKDGVTYTVVGLNSRRPKNAVELERSDGKGYKATVSTVNSMLKLYGVAK